MKRPLTHLRASAAATSKARGAALTVPKPFRPPYPASAVDRFIAWLDHRRYPAWAFLLIVALVSFLALTLVEWREGAYLPGTFRPVHAMAAAYVPFIVGLIRCLDRSAAGALRQFRPALRAGVDPARLDYEITTLPRTATLAVGAASVVVIGLAAWFFIGDIRLLGLASTPASVAVAGVLLAATWWITGVFVYHIVRQLVIIHRIYTQSTRIDFFHLTPLSAFSHHTQRTAIGILIFVYFDFLVADPVLRLHPLNLAAGGTLTLLALVAFVGPLGGAHRLLAAEKTRLLDDNARRLEAGFHELQRRMDTLKLAGADDLNKTLNSLEIERAALQRTPTWPWEPGTIRGLAAAVLLPIVLWLVQFGLQRMLG